VHILLVFSALTLGPTYLVQTVIIYTVLGWRGGKGVWILPRNREKQFSSLIVTKIFYPLNLNELNKKSMFLKNIANQIQIFNNIIIKLFCF